MIVVIEESLVLSIFTTIIITNVQNIFITELNLKVTIEVLHNLDPKQDWVGVHGDYEQFHVYEDSEDYVEGTMKLMKKAAMKFFKFPFHIHFEGYEDEMDSELIKRDEIKIYYQNSGRTVLTTCDGKTYQAEIPSFTATISDEEELESVFAQWFHLASANSMWLITQSSHLRYKNGFATIEINQEPLILLADHDAYGFSLITNHSLYQKEDYLRLILEE